MEIVEKNIGKAQDEESRRLKKEAYEKSRADFLEKLRESSKFQKYVIEPILKDLGEILDIRNCPSGNYEEMGKLVYQNKIVVKEVEKFIAPFRKI